MPRIDGHLLFGAAGTLATLGLSHWQALAAIFAGLGTGCYMFAAAWSKIRANLRARPCEDCPHSRSDRSAS